MIPSKAAGWGEACVPGVRGPETKHPSSAAGWWQEAWHGHCLGLFLSYAESVPRDGWLPECGGGASHFLEISLFHFNKATIISFEGNIPAHWFFDLRIQLLLLDSLPSKSCGRGTGTSYIETKRGHSCSSAVSLSINHHHMLSYYFAVLSYFLLLMYVAKCQSPRKNSSLIPNLIHPCAEHLLAYRHFFNTTKRD